MTQYDDLLKQAQDALSAQTAGINPIAPTYVPANYPGSVVGGSLFGSTPSTTPVCPAGYTYNPTTRMCEPNQVAAATPTDITTTAAPTSEGTQGQSYFDKVSQSNTGTKKPAAWADNVDFTNPESLLTYQESINKSGFTDTLKKGAAVAGALTGSPVLGAATGFFSKGQKISNVAQQRAMINLAEAMGNTTTAKSLQENLDKYIEEHNLGPLTDIGFGSGKQYTNDLLSRYGYDSMDAARKDGFKNILNPTTTPTVTPTVTSSDNRPTTWEGGGVWSSQSDEDRQSVMDKSLSVQRGETQAAGATSPSKQISSEAYSGYGYTGGRATGGLIARRKK